MCIWIHQWNISLTRRGESDWNLYFERLRCSIASTRLKNANSYVSSEHWLAMQSATTELGGFLSSSFFLNAHSLCLFFPGKSFTKPSRRQGKKPSAHVRRSFFCNEKRTDLMWGKINARALPLSMLIPLLRRSRRHLVASIHPSSLSQHPALSLGSGHALSPPLHAREQHHHYCKWQLAGGDGREGCGERPALNLTSSWCWMGITDRSHPH